MSSFTTSSNLTRVRTVDQALPPWVAKKNAEYWDTICDGYKNMAADVQGLNAYRYSHNITGGNQEFMEALSFQHYLETQSLISYDEVKSKMAAMSGGSGPIPFTPEDYILGVCDMTGELMRFSVTSMATSGKLPTGTPVESNKRLKQDSDQDEHGDKMDVDEQAPATAEVQRRRTVLDDLRAIRLQLEMFDAPGGSKFAAELETKKMPVMRECVDKVEKGVYGLTVRGNERPKGWMPDMSSAKVDVGTVELVGA
ncbi:translin-associated factor [Pyrenophora seminiperda CCB06]|uniref:Translin-associated factor n=1 Tax=Pyrenophora seminiperda CCB06 TaxID=1302712 RepID=A0A3M7MD85_9PLEO|nr:translin-associated factor [Pyrenophora seminiperda CCB06]